MFEQVELSRRSLIGHLSALIVKLTECGKFVGEWKIKKIPNGHRYEFGVEITDYPPQIYGLQDGEELDKPE